MMPSVLTKLECKHILCMEYRCTNHQSSPPPPLSQSSARCYLRTLPPFSYFAELRKQTNRNRLMQKSLKGKLLACHPAPKLPRSKSESPPSIHPEQVGRHGLMKLETAANSCNLTSPPSYPASRSRFIIMEIVSACTSSYDNTQSHSRTLPKSRSIAMTNS